MSTTIITEITQVNQETENVNTNIPAVVPAVAQSDAVISVFNPITHGIGKCTFTDYEIKVKPNSSLSQKMHLDLSRTVRRRYNDFVWLYNQLNSQRISLPELPGKKLKVSIIPGLQKYLDKNFENDFIVKRCKDLEVFLNTISSNPLVQANRSFSRFLQEEYLKK